MSDESSSAADESVTETETVDPEKLDDLPSALNFEDASFVFLAGDGWNSASLVEEGYTGTALNDAQYDMELAVEERLNVVISEELFSYWDM